MRTRRRCEWPQPMQQRWLIIQHDGALIVRIERPTLTASRFVAERYSVPSAGDWSVLSRGAVELDGVTGIELRGCSWAQIGGNGVYRCRSYK